MTWQADLEPCTYLTKTPTEQLLAVGWLSSHKPYPTGRTPKEVYDRLIELARDPWSPSTSMGSHECDLCQFTGEAFASANIFIPAGDCLFAAPALIVHYVNAHHYRPPDVFCDAVLACPAMRSREYRDALAKLGAASILRGTSA